MAKKTVKIEESYIEEARQSGFANFNDYVAFLRNYYDEKEKSDKESEARTLASMFNRTIAFIELERMALRKTADALALLLKKTDIELQLSQEEREFLQSLIAEKASSRGN